MAAFKKGEKVIYKSEIVEILEIIKGGKTNKPDMQSGIVMTGYKSKPCTYLLSNNLQIRGNKLKHIK